MLEGTTMRTYEVYCCTKRIKEFSIANKSQVIREDSQVHVRHQREPLEAQEEVTQ